MTFTPYSDSFSTSRDKVRLHIGDTQANSGPRPDKRNFSDEEIAFVLSEEDGRINGAIAYCFEVLASEWTSYALSEREGDIAVDAKETVDKFIAQAKIYRDKPGGTSEAGRIISLVTLQRVDPYTASTEYS